MIGAFVQLNADSPQRDLHPIGYVLAENGCWLWVGTKNSGGYAMTWHPTRKCPVYSHRHLYEAAIGPIPEGMQLDHLCRRRDCVNPAHMEPVTPAENTRRSEPAMRTHCIHGHEFTTANTYYRVSSSRGVRQCRACNAKAVARYQARKRELQAA